MKKSYSYILDQLPYAHPFLFVDEILNAHDTGIDGSYTFKADADFYTGHFKNNPVTLWSHIDGVLCPNRFGLFGHIFNRER